MDGTDINNLSNYVTKQDLYSQTLLHPRSQESWLDSKVSPNPAKVAAATSLWSILALFVKKLNLVF